MDKLSEIKQNIRQMCQGVEQPQLFTAKVIAVDGASCTIEREDLNLTDVRLQAVATGQAGCGLLIAPAVGSFVLVADLSGGKMTSLVITQYSQIDSITLDADTTITINGGNNGGLVIAQRVQDSLNSLKQYCEDLKSAITTGINNIGAGSSANGATGKAAFETAMAGKTITFDNIENTNITH